MKKSILLLMGLCIIAVYPLKSQGLLNRVKKAVSKEITGVVGGGDSNSQKAAPEPACACTDARFILDLGKYKLDYSEISINQKDDGSLLVFDRINQKYYIIRDGATKGPYDESDPAVTAFSPGDDQSGNEDKRKDMTSLYPAYISKSGEKYIIKFGGKSYGPYAIINDFAVSRSHDKFAAMVTENVVVTEDQGKKMEEAMKNAKTEQEKIEIGMKLSQQIQDQMMKGGGPESLQAKMISNVPGATYDPLKEAMAKFNSKVKFNEIMVVAPDKIFDLKGNLVLTLSQNSYTLGNFFVKSDNSRYAWYNSGTLSFSDNTMMSDLFSPYLVSSDGKVSLTYMYYSPGKNAIMQCAIPF